MTGNCSKIYERFTERNSSPDRHRGHVVNDCYPEKTPNKDINPISYENFVSGIIDRGMDSFEANGPDIVVDTTDFNDLHIETLIEEINSYREEMLYG